MTKKFAKRIVAVFMAITVLCVMCISASAASYTSTTTYYNNLENIQVSTTVYDLTAKDQITYLAYKNADASTGFNAETSEIVYINQYIANEDETTAKTFSYVTKVNNVGSSIKMAKTDSTFANGEEISTSQNETGKIDGGTVAFNVTVNDAAPVVANVECERGVQLVNIPVSLVGKNVTGLTVDGADYGVGDVIVTGTGVAITLNITKIAYDIVITTVANDIEPAAPEAVAKFVDYDYSQTFEDETVSGTAYAIIADATHTPANYEFGVAFSDDKITKETNLATLANGGMFASEGSARGTDNKFAIVILDVNNPKNGEVVYYATYMKDTKGTITIGSTGSITLKQN